MSAALPELVQWVLAEDPATSEPLPPPVAPVTSVATASSSATEAPSVAPSLLEAPVIAPEAAPSPGFAWDPWEGLHMFSREELDMHEIMDPAMYEDDNDAPNALSSFITPP